MIGDEFCDEFRQPKKTHNQANIGFSPENAKIGFITQTPLLNKNQEFLPKKSAQMLENIITKVFHLTQQDCCILSLFKTDQISYDEHLKQHVDILLSQILSSDAKVFVIFGHSELTAHLLQKDLQLGILVSFRNKLFITTHSFQALIKLATLKKQTLEHLNTAKALL